MPASPAETYAAIVGAICTARDHITLETCIIRDDAVGCAVDVRLALPGHSDSSLPFHAGRAQSLPPMQGGVHIFEREGPLLHSRTMVIDGVWARISRDAPAAKGSIREPW